MLLTDEAVSNLDEQALQAAMAGVSRGRTTLLIAHRLSTIRSADRIVVLEAGRVVETGTTPSCSAPTLPTPSSSPPNAAGVIGL